MYPPWGCHCKLTGFSHHLSKRTRTPGYANKHISNIFKAFKLLRHINSLSICIQYVGVAIHPTFFVNLTYKPFMKYIAMIFTNSRKKCCQALALCVESVCEQVFVCFCLFLWFFVWFGLFFVCAGFFRVFFFIYSFSCLVTSLVLFSFFF